MNIYDFKDPTGLAPEKEKGGGNKLQEALTMETSYQEYWMELIRQLEMQQARYLERMLGYDAEKMNEFLSKIPVGGGGSTSGNRTGTDESDNGGSSNGVSEKGNSNKNGKSFIVKLWDNVLNFFGLGSNEKTPYITIDVQKVRWGKIDDESQFGKDLTHQFEKDLNNMTSEFTKLKNISKLESGGNYFFEYQLEFFSFGMTEYLGRNTNELNLKQNPLYTNSDGGLFYGRFMNPDDFGNFAYGASAKASGISLEDALIGAGLFGLINGSSKDYLNFQGAFDEFRDTKMIKEGYLWKKR